MRLIQNIKILTLMIRAFIRFVRDDTKRGTFIKNLISLATTKEIAADMSWAELLEEKAGKHPQRVFLLYKEKKFTYRDMDENANRTAQFLKEEGGDKGKGIAIFMNNSANFLDVFFGSQKIGMYSVPINTSLRGDSLIYILNHCDAEYLVIDEEYIDMFINIQNRLDNIKTILVNSNISSKSEILPQNMQHLLWAYDKPADKPEGSYNKDDICFILYTSGTTGLPKGVVYRYRKNAVKLLSIVAYLLLNKNDILYTCLPLFHGNALFLTITLAMHIGAKVALVKRFSASRFWDDIRHFNITTFNTIGAMIPILMKQPEKENDSQNKVRFTLSAACPADDWVRFENRFGIKIFEGYGAIDGGGKSIMNLGNAPVGSIGKPSPGVEYRLVDENMNDVPDGTPGELIFASKGKGKSVEYYKNEKASNEKLRDGWIYTGDLVRRDKKGYLYFVGRNTESMRIKGENVSAYEVEHAILKHPSVLEAAVYAVPSELAEDDIMASISLVEGRDLHESALADFLKENLAKFAIPRYVKIVTDFPKTETQRIIKRDLEKTGVTAGTFDTKTGEYIQKSKVS